MSYEERDDITYGMGFLGKGGRVVESIYNGYGWMTGDFPDKYQKPLQDSVARFIRAHRDRLDPWFRKMAERKGVFDPNHKEDFYAYNEWSADRLPLLKPYFLYRRDTGYYWRLWLPGKRTYADSITGVNVLGDQIVLACKGRHPWWLIGHGRESAFNARRSLERALRTTAVFVEPDTVYRRFVADRRVVWNGGR